LTDAIAVADAHLVVGQTVDGEVLAEVAVGQVGSPEEGLPVPVRVQLVDEDGSVRAPMPPEVTLAVAVDVQTTHHAWAVDGSLPDPGVDARAPPRDVDRKPDVDRDERRRCPRHRTTLRPGTQDDGS